MPKIAALIVAAGRGERAGGALPKQYRALAGQPMLRRSAEAFASHAALIQVVIGADQGREYETAMLGLACLPPVGGGAARQQSVRNGLEGLAKHKPDLVLIHDAARPLVSSALITRVIAALADSDAAIPLLS